MAIQNKKVTGGTHGLAGELNLAGGTTLGQQVLLTASPAATTYPLLKDTEVVRIVAAGCTVLLKFVTASFNAPVSPSDLHEVIIQGTTMDIGLHSNIGGEKITGVSLTGSPGGIMYLIQK